MKKLISIALCAVLATGSAICAGAAEPKPHEGVKILSQTLITRDNAVNVFAYNISPDSKSGIILYNAPVRNLDWFVDSGWGMRFDRLKAEIERIEKYSAFGHLANAQEVVEYQQWKEKQ